LVEDGVNPEVVLRKIS
jgi:hypothetical protein